MNSLPCLLGETLDELKALAVSNGLPAFVGKQMADWIYRKRVADVNGMNNVSKAARQLLSEKYIIGRSEPVEKQESKDGTIKYLYATKSGHFIETVYIPDGERATLCVSSQSGCKMHCAFCMTGRQGYAESLTAADILNQIFSLPQFDRLTNIVFMGQGEPLDNLDNVLRAIDVLTAQWGLAWSPKRITLSSVGLAKGLVRFLEESTCHLAISLHHPIPTERARLMPAEKAFGIEQIVGLLEQYGSWQKPGRSLSDEGSHQRRLSFEYILFKGVNDTMAHADALLRLLRNLDCRINLIRFHSIPDTPLEPVSEERMTQFRNYLTAHGLFTTIRASRGQDIFAACGLLSTAKNNQQQSLSQNH